MKETPHGKKQNLLVLVQNTNLITVRIVTRARFQKFWMFQLLVEDHHQVLPGKTNTIRFCSDKKKTEW